MTFQTLRSVSDVHVFVRERPRGCSEAGPVAGQPSRQPEYRLALERDGYVLVKCEHAVFNPEV